MIERERILGKEKGSEAATEAEKRHLELNFRIVEEGEGLRVVRVLGSGAASR